MLLSRFLMPLSRFLDLTLYTENQVFGRYDWRSRNTPNI